MQIQTLTPQLASQALDRFQNDPVYFCDKVLGATLWKRQQDIIEAIRDYGEVYVPSCHSSGKSYVSAHVALWFLYTHPNCIVVTTAPTGRQVKRILWQEIRKAYAAAKYPLGGEILKQELQIDDKWYAFGFSSDEPTNFSGIHADWVLFIVDEATGIDTEIWEAIDGVLSGDNTRLLAIGNPTDETSEFAKRIKKAGEREKIIRITAFDTPNFTESGITEADIASGAWKAKLEAAGGVHYPYLSSPNWVAKIYEKYGPESAMYLSRIKAQFPTAGSDALIPLSWIERAQARWQDFTDKLKAGEVALDTEDQMLGVDVAEFGSDSTVRTKRQGQYIPWQRTSSQEDTMVTAGRVANDLHDDDNLKANVDVVGIGNGVARRLQELFPGRVDGVNVGERAREPERFVNRKAELFWELRTLFEQGGIMIPADEELEEELSVIKYKVVDSNGKIKITSKDDLRKPDSLGRSPDRADSLVLSIATPELIQPVFGFVG